MTSCIFENIKPIRRLRVRNQYMRELLGELLGTFVLTFLSMSVGAQYTFGKDEGLSSFLTVNLGNGFALTLGIYIAQNVSGGCVNPCISLAMCLTNRMPWKKYPFHLIGQLIGAFFAACMVFAVYHEKFDQFDGGVRQLRGENGTAAIFCFFPQDYLSAGGGLLDSAVGTAMMVLVTLAVIDERNAVAPAPWYAPLPVGLSLLVIGMGTGYNAGYPLNPARDFAPRLFITMAGWGGDAFGYRGGNWFWVPLLGPMLGSSTACLLYWAFVSLHWPDEDEDVNLEMTDCDAKYALREGRNGNSGTEGE